MNNNIRNKQKKKRKKYHVFPYFYSLKVCNINKNNDQQPPSFFLTSHGGPVWNKQKN